MCFGRNPIFIFILTLSIYLKPMSNFKEHIKSCKSDITVEIAHLQDVTFADICYLIHLIVSQKRKLLLSDEVKHQLGYEALSQSNSIKLQKVKNAEELMLLLYISDGLYSNQNYGVDIAWDAKQNGMYVYHPRYKMTSGFVPVAEYYGISNYPFVKKLICNFDMFEDFDIAADERFLEYINN
jgi:hypothetical protein